MLDSTDEGLPGYLSEGFTPPLKKTKRQVTSQQLARSLKNRWGLSESICRALEGNSVDGDTFMNLTRDDLHDLLGKKSTFLERKELWDCLQQVQCSGLKSPFNEEEDGIQESVASLSGTDTMSVDSDSESDRIPLSQSQPSTSRSVPKLKRTRPMKLGRQNSGHESPADQDLSKPSIQLEFKFPVCKRIMEYCKEGKPLEEEDRKQLVRDCVTCLKAECGDRISKEQFKSASQVICAKVPVLKDVKPPNWPEDEEFHYSASVEYLLKKRYTNLKSKSKVMSKPVLQSSSLPVQAKDADKIHQEIQKEVQKGSKKKEINWPAVKSLQRLSFAQRKEDIETMCGPKVVDKILEKYPFLDNERILWSELELHISEELTEESIQVEKFFERWRNISKCFVDEEMDEDDRCSKALVTMPKAFNSSAPALVSFLPHGSNPDDFLKTLSSNDPQLLSYSGEEDMQDPTKQQWFVVVDKEIVIECKTHLGCNALITLIASHFAFNLRYHDSHSVMFKFLHEHILGEIPRRKSYAYKKLENSILAKLQEDPAATSGEQQAV